MTEDNAHLVLRVVLPSMLDPCKNQSMFLDDGRVCLRPLFMENGGNLSVCRCAVALSQGPLTLANLDLFDTQYGDVKAVFLHDTWHLPRSQKVTEQSCELARLLRELQEGRELDEQRLMRAAWDPQTSGALYGASKTVDTNRVADALDRAWFAWQNKRERGWFTQDVVLDKMRLSNEAEEDLVALNYLQGAPFYLKRYNTADDVFQFPCLTFPRPSEPFAMCLLRHTRGKWRLEMELVRTLCQEVEVFPDDLPFCYEWIVIGYVVMSSNDRRRWKYESLNKDLRSRQNWRFLDARRVVWLTLLKCDLVDIVAQRAALEELRPDGWELSPCRDCQSWGQVKSAYNDSKNGLLVQRGRVGMRLSRGRDRGSFDRVNMQWINWTRPLFVKDGARVVGSSYSAKTGALLAWRVVFQGRTWYARTSVMPRAYNLRDWSPEETQDMTVGLVMNDDVIKPKAFAIDFDVERGGYDPENVDTYVDFLVKLRYQKNFESDDEEDSSGVYVSDETEDEVAVDSSDDDNKT